MYNIRNKEIIFKIQKIRILAHYFSIVWNIHFLKIKYKHITWTRFNSVLLDECILNIPSSFTFSPEEIWDQMREQSNTETIHLTLAK